MPYVMFATYKNSSCTPFGPIFLLNSLETFGEEKEQKLSTSLFLQLTSVELDTLLLKPVGHRTDGFDPDARSALPTKSSNECPRPGLLRKIKKIDRRKGVA